MIDTSVLVAGMQALHAQHHRALPVLVKAQSGQLEAVVSAHSLAETYSVLTRMPLLLRISPARAWLAIEANVLSVMQVYALSSIEYRELLEHLAQTNLTGGITYDCVIAWVALKTQVDQIITLNPKDFRRVVPALSAQIIVP